MSLRVCCYEDETYSDFFPLTYTRPVYLLRPGAVPLFRRVEQHFPGASITLVARDQMAPLLAEQISDVPVTIVKRDDNSDVLLLNGRIRSYGDLPDLVKNSRLSTVFRVDHSVVAVLFKMDVCRQVPVIATHVEYTREYQSQKSDIPEKSTSATLYHNLWEMIADIESAVAMDIEYLRKSSGLSGGKARVQDGAFLVNADRVVLGNGVEVFPGAVIDASKGPVLIGEGTRVESHAAIYGPCYVGANSVVLAGKVSQCSIGPTCRVGGEVEQSMFHAYVNKYHAGFIGHSIVGSWVNFGAMTTNSDLKNNYSSIRVSMNGKMVNTGSIKVGSFIGDHTKFGIGTLLNTGINIGVCCNIFGGGLTSDKEVPSFRWGNTGSYETYKFEKAMETAQKTSERRKVTLSSHETELLKQLSEGRVNPAGVVEF